MAHNPSRNGHSYHGVTIGDHAHDIHLGDKVGVTINTKVAARTDFVGHYSHKALLPVPTFVDRPGLREELRAQFLSDISQDGGHGRIVIVHGAGGVGKSQLVLNFVQLHRSGYRAIFWIEAATKAGVERDFVQIHHLLYEIHNVPGLQPVRAEDAVPAVKRWFYGSRKRWLFIFDSADHVEPEHDPTAVDLRYFMPYDPSVDVIITTRNANVSKMSRLGGLEVAEMTSKEAITLFLKEAEITAITGEQKAEVALIVEEVGYLALAVSLAGAYVAATPRLRTDITLYLPEYRQRRRELLDQKPEQLVHQYGASVLTTWETSYAAVHRREPWAGHLLSLLGWLHWEDIFMSLFEAFEDSKEPKEIKTDALALSDSILFSTGHIDLYRVEKCFSILRTYSLVKFQADTGSYSMHRLIHAWSTDRLGLAERKKYQVASMILLKHSLSNEKYQSPMMRTRLVPHLMSNFSLGSTIVCDQVKDEPIMEYFHAMAEFTNSAGQWKETTVIKNFLYESVGLWCGPKHLGTINVMSNLARTLCDLGQLEKAAMMQQQVLSTREQVLGVDHLDTIMAMSNLAITLRYLGELDRAAAIQQQVLFKRQQILGEDHLETVKAMSSLANTLSTQGQHEAAATMQRQVLSKEQRDLGANHPDTIGTMNNLASSLANKGDLEAAISMNQEVLLQMRLILGEDHPQTIGAMGNLAHVLGVQGHLEAAASMKQEVLSRMRQVLGEDHPSTIGAMSNLADTLHDLNELSTAASMQQQVLSKRQKIFGDDHPDTIVAMSDLAITLRGQSLLEAAAMMQGLVLSKRKQMLGADHQSTIIEMSDLASTLGCQGKLDEAVVLHEEVLSRLRKTLKEDHRDTVHATNLLAITLSNQGRLQEAALMLEASVKLLRQTVGDDHFLTRKTAETLSTVLHFQGDVD